MNSKEVEEKKVEGEYTIQEMSKDLMETVSLGEDEPTFEELVDEFTTNVLEFFQENLEDGDKMQKYYQFKSEVSDFYYTLIKETLNSFLEINQEEYKDEQFSDDEEEEPTVNPLHNDSPVRYVPIERDSRMPEVEMRGLPDQLASSLIRQLGAQSGMSFRQCERCQTRLSNPAHTLCRSCWTPPRNSHGHSRNYY